MPPSPSGTELPLAARVDQLLDVVVAQGVQTSAGLDEQPRDDLGRNRRGNPLGEAGLPGGGDEPGQVGPERASVSGRLCNCPRWTSQPVHLVQRAIRAAGYGCPQEL
jgi:hypothetical protein